MRGPLLAVLLLLAATAPARAASARSLNEEGNRAYRSAEFEAALRSYTEAQVSAPESPVIQYNIGNVFYRQEEYGRAAEAYRKALQTAPAPLARDAAYNLGNSRFMAGDYAGAVEAYRGALRLDPADRDAKRNLEIALSLLKPPPPQGGGGQRDPDRDRSQEARQPPEAGSQPQAQPRPEHPQAREGELEREEAERLLDALAHEERQNLERSRRDARSAPAGGKDW